MRARAKLHHWYCSASTGKRWFIILGILFTLWPTHSSAVPLRAQPLLLALSAQNPTARISVIVQKQEATLDLSALIQQLGGAITTDLQIIRGFAAELPAHAIPQLASAAGVRWVSLDAPMQQTNCTQCVNISQLKNTYNRSIRAD